MIIKKITTGFVIQTFDTKTKTFIAQEFVAGDDCVYEDERGNGVESGLLEDESGNEAYLPYEMKI